MNQTVEAYLPNVVLRLIDRLKGKKVKRIKRRQLPAEQYESLDALKCCIWYNEYGGYCLPESSLHRSAARRVLKAEVFEPDTIAFMRSHCANGDIVHAGTYFGDFLPALSKSLASDAMVWAFEPNPENFRCAQITASINGLENVSLRNAGLGEKQETLRMRTRDEFGRGLGGKSHMVDAKQFNSATDEDVHIETVDDIVSSDRMVSIIQLDVEDHEKAAITGALQTIRRCLPILIVEVRRGSELLESQWFEESILSMGYRQTGTLHNNTVFQHTS